MNASRCLLCLLSLGFLLGGNACQQEPPSPGEGLAGDWQWVRSQGGFTGKQVLKPAPGQALVYRFTRDGYWSECFNGVCSRPTPFTLQREPSVLTGDQQLVLTLHRRVELAPPDTGTHLLPSRLVVQEISDTLHLIDDWADGYGQYYRKK